MNISWISAKLGPNRTTTTSETQRLTFSSGFQQYPTIVSQPKCHHWSLRVEIVERHRHHHVGWAMEEGQAPMQGPSATATERPVRRNNAWAQMLSKKNSNYETWKKYRYWLKGGKTLWVSGRISWNHWICIIEMMLGTFCHATFSVNMTYGKIWWIPWAQGCFFSDRTFAQNLSVKVWLCHRTFLDSFEDPSNWMLFPQPTHNRSAHLLGIDFKRLAKTHVYLLWQKWILWPLEGPSGTKCLSQVSFKNSRKSKRQLQKTISKVWQDNFSRHFLCHMFFSTLPLQWPLLGTVVVNPE